jgi:hypothetical protein
LAHGGRTHPKPMDAAELLYKRFRYSMNQVMSNSLDGDLA